MKITYPVITALVCSASLLTACGGSSNDTANTTPTPLPSISEASSETEIEFPETQTNTYFPIASGLAYIYEPIDGEEEDVDDLVEDDEDVDAEDLSVQVHFTTTRMLIDGVNAVAIIEKEYEDEGLVEESTQWVAMDTDGAIWLLGESSTSFVDGEVEDEDSWVAGVDGAERGLLMPAAVDVGDEFIIEQLPDAELETGQVISVSESISLEDIGDYDDVLLIRETSDDEEGMEVEDKFYAPGLGLIRYIEDEDFTFELDGIESIVELSLDVAEDTMPVADESFGEFEDVGFEIEYDAAEGEASVVIEIELDDISIEELKIWDPEGELLAEIEADELEDLGFSELVLETGEASLEELMDELDEGVYTFLAESDDDVLLFGQATLSHEVLDATEIGECDAGLDIDAASITWTAVDEAESYEVEISAEDEDEIDFEMQLELSSDVTSFTVPSSLLESEADYVVEVSVENEEGNITSTECEFSIN